MKVFIEFPWVELLLLLFVGITFGQSAWDKVSDWKGNVSWLKEHFGKTVLKDMVPMALGLVLLLEVLAGFTAVMGIFNLGETGDSSWTVVSLVLSGLCLLILLLGQRLAKDYDGARTIVIYLIPVIFGLYILT